MEVVKENLKKELPSILNEKNLLVNETKSEEYVNKRGEDESWKNCKYWGGLLDTDKDINQRKNICHKYIQPTKIYFWKQKNIRKNEIQNIRKSCWKYIHIQLWSMDSKE